LKNYVISEDKQYQNLKLYYKKRDFENN